MAGGCGAFAIVTERFGGIDNEIGAGAAGRCIGAVKLFSNDKKVEVEG